MPLADKDNEWEVESIIGKGKIKGQLHYIVKWKGWLEEHDL